MADQTGLEKTAGQLYWKEQLQDSYVGEKNSRTGSLVNLEHRSALQDACLKSASLILVLSYALSGNTLRPLRSFGAPESGGLAPRSVLSPACNQERHNLIHHGVRLSEAVVSFDWRCQKQVEPALCAATGRATLSPRGCSRA